MGKPSKWLRKLLGVKKKSSSKESPAKRSDDIQEKSREKHGWCIGASDSSNRTGGLQQIPAAQPKEPTAIVEISEKSPNPHVEVEETIASAIEASPNLAWTTKEKQREEQAAIKIQTAFRAYLAQRALCALKGLVRLQALVRGHLTRKEAAVALRTTLSIVKVQAHIRGYNVRRSKVGQVILKQRKSRRQNEGEFWAITDTRNAIFLNTTFQHQLFIYAPGQYMLFSSSRPSGWAWLERWTASEVWVTALRASEIDDGENNAGPTWSLKGNTDFSSGFQDWSTQNAFPDLHEQYISPVKSHASNGFHHYNGSDHSHLSKHSSPHSLQQKGEVNHQLVGSDGGSSNNLGHENGFSNGKQLHKHIEQNGFASSKDNFNYPSPSSKPSVKRGAIKAESAEGAMQGTHAIPSYMATTQSSKAKVRVNSPKNKSDNEEKSPQTMKRRFSLPGSNGRIHSETTRPRRLSLQAEA